MLKKLDITNFGSFTDFKWKNIRDSGNNNPEFKKLNILYGRNYSGKTTLSKIIQCLETKNLPSGYDNHEFEITANERKITKVNLDDVDFEVRVFNTHFTKTHLGFLSDDKNEITSFAILGEENNKITQEIKKKTIILEGHQGETGIRKKFENSNAEFSQKQTNLREAEKALDDKLKDKATSRIKGIKHNPLYGDANYNITKIKSDIRTITASNITPLSQEIKTQYENILKEEKPQKCDQQLHFTTKINELIQVANRLISQRISPSNAQQELINNELLQTWVKQGMDLHYEGKEKTREICGFCGNKVPDELWDKLSRHFNQQTKELEKAINNHLSNIQTERIAIKLKLKTEGVNVHSLLKLDFSSNVQSLNTQINAYDAKLKDIEKKLTTKLANIYQPVATVLEEYDTTKLTTLIKTLNDIIQQSDAKIENFQSEIEDSKNKLKLNDILAFITDIDYFPRKEAISKLEKEKRDLQSQKNELAQEIEKTEEVISQLNISIKDEKKGAEQVNKYLNNYFGHNALKVQAIENSETKTCKFKIYRGEKPAFNLSEGECSLVAFCYFMAKLQDHKSSDKEVVIYIDDPISSLDSNHIFFIFSLIESQLTVPVKEDGKLNRYRYKQLFISTHNLEFLKYLKRLTRPKKDKQLDLEEFIISKRCDYSTITLMPPYLKNYVTELNYLFGEIVSCAKGTNAGNNHSFYNFGNNLRKFLEVFLFFKYPSGGVGNDDHNKNMKKFLTKGENETTQTEVILVNRIINEYSHQQGLLERAMEPIDNEEIETTACFILKKIKESDAEQYENLLKSVQENDPLLS